MSMQDTIADMLTRIRNGQQSNHKTVKMFHSTIKENIAKVLKDEGYILGYETYEDDKKKYLVISLKYHLGQPVIDMIKRISRPGLRVYKSADELPKVRNGLGIAIISTSKGIVSDKKAKQLGQGGEVICMVA